MIYTGTNWTATKLAHFKQKKFVGQSKILKYSLWKWTLFRLPRISCIWWFISFLVVNSLTIKAKYLLGTKEQLFVVRNVYAVAINKTWNLWLRLANRQMYEAKKIICNHNNHYWHERTAAHTVWERVRWIGLDFK